MSWEREKKWKIREVDFFFFPKTRKGPTTPPAIAREARYIFFSPLSVQLKPETFYSPLFTLYPPEASIATAPFLPSSSPFSSSCPSFPSLLFQFRVFLDFFLFTILSSSVSPHPLLISFFYLHLYSSNASLSSLFLFVSTPSPPFSSFPFLPPLSPSGRVTDKEANYYQTFIRHISRISSQTKIVPLIHNKLKMGAVRPSGNRGQGRTLEGMELTKMWSPLRHSEGRLR